MIKWIVNQEDQGKRLLSFVRGKADSAWTTKDLRFAIEHLQCCVNGRVESFSSHRLSCGDRVEITLKERPHFAVEKARVIYEDEEIFVYNKPMHLPTTGEKSLESLLKYIAVHRLDRDTTGIIVFAKSKCSVEALEELFRKRQMEKSYLAIVEGVPQEVCGVIQNTLGKVYSRQGAVKWGVKERGLMAKTTWAVEHREKGYALLRCTPLTGRTHQIRVHLAHIGHPVVGDVCYGKREGQKAMRPLLHSEKLCFIHPFTGEHLSFHAPLPKDFVEFFSVKQLSSL